MYQGLEIQYQTGNSAVMDLTLYWWRQCCYIYLYKKLRRKINLGERMGIGVREYWGRKTSRAIWYTLSLRCLLDTQEEMLRNQLNMCI